MADTQNLRVSKSDWNGNFVPKHTARLIRDGINDGSAPFIPEKFQRSGGVSFTATLSPQLIYNANTGYALDAKDLIPVQLERAAKGYGSAVVGTYRSAENAGTRIKKDEKGVWFNFKGTDGEFHHSAYYFPEQMEHPKRLADFAQKNFRQPQNLVSETIRVNSSEVSEYLGAYVAACKSGAKIEVSTEVAEQFRQNILAVADNELKRTNAEKNPQIPKLSDVLFNAERKAGEIVKSIEKERRLSPEPQKKVKKNVRRIDRSAAMSY